MLMAGQFWLLTSLFGCQRWRFVAMDGGGLLTNGVVAGPWMYDYPWTMAGEEDILQCISFPFLFFFPFFF
jgi:hypothetical protein